ncbi:hypothetical protein ACLN7K_005123, partial [Escherichia coli]
VVITTYSSAGGYAMNNCEFNGFVMPGGWSDRGSYAAGFFSIYSTAERAIHSIISGVKDDDFCSVFYVEARAFPINIFAEEGLNVIVPTADYAVGQTTYKWGATDPLSESTNAQIILDFKNGRGYYCSHPFISSLSGNAATATKLQTARTIGGVSFDGTANINLPGVNTTGNQNTTGNAATATKLQTARTINGVSFDGTKDITLTPKDLDAYSKSEVQSALAGKQPLDNTLTNLSGKDVAGLLAYLGLGEGAPAIGVPFFWPSAAMPNTVIDSWSSMVFLKFNGAKFSATDYPVLAKVFPALALPDARGDFIRIWDDGRGIDVGRTLLSGQSHTIMDHAHNMELWTGDGLAAGSAREGVNPGILATYGDGGIVKTDEPGLKVPSSLRALSSRSVKRYGEISGNVDTETRPRNIAFNFLVRAK